MTVNENVAFLIEQIIKCVKNLPQTLNNREKINKIIEDLRSVQMVFATNSSNIPSPIKKTRVDLVATLKSMCEAIQVRVGPKNKPPQIEIDSQAPEIYVFGNEAILQDLFLNLISNGIKYGNNSVLIKITTTNTHVAIKFYDNGHGIYPTDTEKVFSSGYRNPSVIHKTPGKGVGLTSAQKGAQWHGGTIKIEKNNGELFPVVSLPLTNIGASSIANNQKTAKEIKHDINNLLHLILGKIILLTSIYNETKITQLFNQLKSSINNQSTTQVEPFKVPSLTR